jgi:hypothetical protein
MGKSHILITQIDGEVKVIGEDPLLQSNFKDHLSILILSLLTLLPHKTVSPEFIFMVKAAPA